MTTVLKAQYEDHEIIPSGEPDWKALRAEDLEVRRAAATRILKRNNEFAPKVAEAKEEFEKARLGLTSAEEVMSQASKVFRDADVKLNSLIHQRDAANSKDEDLIEKHPDTELCSLRGRLEADLHAITQESTASRRWESRVRKLKSAIARARDLERSPNVIAGIIDMVKLEAAMASVLVSDVVLAMESKEQI